MELLLILGLIIFLLFRAGKSSSPKPKPQSTEDRLSQRNQDWAMFIAGYLPKAKTPAERKLLQRMLDDIESKGLLTEATKNKVLATNAFQSTTVSSLPPQAPEMSYEEAKIKELYGGTEESIGLIEPAAQPETIQLDNASLLLYFGAFLFVASVGLFIAFGGTNGAIRTVAVLLVMAVLYGGGQWLFRTKPKLEQAGLAFAGMGMAIAPLAGVAAYYYLFNETQGPLIWMLTSLLCMSMYAHALISLRRPLISYLLIFTFLSLFESGVSIIDAPVYYFSWAMAITGIILTVVSRAKGFWPELQESSRASSAVFLPLAILASGSLIAEHGVIQFAVSLFIAAAYYGLETMNSSGEQQEMNAAVAQVAAVSGVAALAYGISENWVWVALSLLIVGILQLLAVIFWQVSRLSQNFASILILVLGTALIAGIQSPAVILGAVAALGLAGSIIWIKQQRVDMFAVGFLSWLALPIVFGQVFLEPAAAGDMQTGLSFSVLVMLITLYAWHKPHSKIEGWASAAQQLVIVGVVMTLITSFFAPAWICLLAAVGLLVSLLALAEHEMDSDWAVVGGLIIAAPIVKIWDSPGALVATNMLALIANMFVALRHRNEITRWFSTLLWLLMPLTVGANFPGAWFAREYAWSYVLVMIGLLVSRAIARGVVFRSSKVPLATFARTASQSYVVGYCTAGLLAVFISLGASNAQLHATLILLFMTAVTYVLSKWIEKQPDILALVPVLLQAVLWSALRPIADSAETYLILSIVLAFGSYALASLGKDNQQIRLGALLTTFIAPASFMVIGETLLPMPIGLFLAGIIVYQEISRTNQANRELAGSISVAAFMWLLGYSGVRELQAYTHILAGMFGAYAYWRSIRGELEASDQYLYAMLGTATVPLALQAIGGEAGGLYGWWLLLEQVGFMLLGMAIGKRFVTFWGLYVAIASVLYQLRNLGWAALTVLAMFLIGLAMYYLQKHSDDTPRS